LPSPALEASGRWQLRPGYSARNGIDGSCRHDSCRCHWSRLGGAQRRTSGRWLHQLVDLIAGARWRTRTYGAGCCARPKEKGWSKAGQSTPVIFIPAHPLGSLVPSVTSTAVVVDDDDAVGPLGLARLTVSRSMRRLKSASSAIVKPKPHFGNGGPSTSNSWRTRSSITKRRCRRFSRVTAMPRMSA
jgi:hypothetical protein